MALQNYKDFYTGLLGRGGSLYVYLCDYTCEQVPVEARKGCLNPLCQGETDKCELSHMGAGNGKQALSAAQKNYHSACML